MRRAGTAWYESRQSLLRYTNSRAAYVFSVYSCSILMVNQNGLRSYIGGFAFNNCASLYSTKFLNRLIHRPRQLDIIRSLNIAKSAVPIVNLPYLSTLIEGAEC